MKWEGVLPAITTPFTPAGAVDETAVAKKLDRLEEAGCHAIVPGGSLGEGTTLSFEEKTDLTALCVRHAEGRLPIVPGIAAASTDEAVRLARAAAESGASGLMVLPPYLHRGPVEEVTLHIGEIVASTSLPCMLYNNPAAYGADLTPDIVAQIAADHPNVQAVKDSSGDVRRLTALSTELGDRLTLLVGLDDVLVEGVHAGASGWVAGLVNAFPKESVALFHAARARSAETTRALYAWFLPLLRLDTEPEFVQLIKQVEALVLGESAAVRPPRRPLSPTQARRVESLVEAALSTRGELMP